jgi:hypothetical protein
LHHDDNYDDNGVQPSYKHHYYHRDRANANVFRMVRRKCPPVVHQMHVGSLHGLLAMHECPHTAAAASTASATEDHHNDDTSNYEHILFNDDIDDIDDNHHYCSQGHNNYCDHSSY